MELITDIANYKADEKSVLTVGTFDGVHLGHQKIIRKLMDIAAETGALSTLVSFEPHPQLVLKKSNKPDIKILTTKQEKIDLLEKTGLDRLILIQFTPEFSKLPPGDFVRSILLDKLNMSHFIIGHDHAFGKDRQGNIDLLEAMGREAGFSVDTVEPVMDNSNLISSTNIRNLLLAGDVELAARFLGRPYRICGTVVKGYGRGKELGFPTANIKPLTANKLVPKVGIYATKIAVGYNTFDSVTYIGHRPTFNLTEKVIEVHVLGDFEDELYDKDVELYFYSFIRDDARFDTTEQLIEQIKEDKEQSLEILSKA